MYEDDSSTPSLIRYRFGWKYFGSSNPVSNSSLPIRPYTFLNTSVRLPVGAGCISWTFSLLTFQDVDCLSNGTRLPSSPMTADSLWLTQSICLPVASSISLDFLTIRVVGWPSTAMVEEMASALMSLALSALS